MNKLDITKVPKLKPNPIFKGLPSKLKDPKYFIKIQKELADILKSNHKHGNPSDWIKCEECQANYSVRKKLMKKMGFKSASQFLEWRKIMQIISSKSNFQVR